MLTAKEFAAATEISYPVVIRWLAAGIIPGKREQFGQLELWRIPLSAVAEFKKPEKRPVRGRPKDKKKK